MTLSETQSFIRIMSEKASNTYNAVDALQFSQAAANVANAYAALVSAELARERGP